MSKLMGKLQRSNDLARHRRRLKAKKEECKMKIALGAVVITYTIMVIGSYLLWGQ